MNNANGFVLLVCTKNFKKERVLTMSYQQMISHRKEMKILSLKGTKRIRETKTSLEALKNVFKLAGGSARNVDDRSIDSQNLRGENSEGKGAEHW